MGGSGSGQWYRWNSKPTTENFHRFGMPRLCELGVVRDMIHRHGSWQWTCDDQVISSLSYEVSTLNWSSSWIRVYYTDTKSGTRHDYKIFLTTTHPNYGGLRWWFLCPGYGCGKRVGVLYLRDVLACRHCWGVSYISQRQTLSDRLCDKASAIAQNLGLQGNVIDGFYGKKPKSMHWKTYRQKIAEMENAAKTGLLGAPVNRHIELAAFRGL